MNSQELVKERLDTSLQKCQLHLQRLNYALHQAESKFPLTVEKYNELTPSDIGNIDQMIFRFTKLQDEIGNHTFRFLLGYLLEDISNKPFRDILNLLERLQIIESANIWITLREIRNDLAHEYPIMVNETIEKLNYAVIQIPTLEKIYQSIVEKVN